KTLPSLAHREIMTSGLRGRSGGGVSIPSVRAPGAAEERSCFQAGPKAAGVRLPDAPNRGSPPARRPWVGASQEALAKVFRSKIPMRGRGDASSFADYPLRGKASPAPRLGATRLPHNPEAAGCPVLRPALLAIRPKTPYIRGAPGV